ncbi:type 2 isopentenyl-diphosphate Delta-isomerase [Pseudoxanthomonas composti]|uniref:Isopentenyl-diphosphate delta-isomerase n=1 Tax=Pseudoxanthomonas composti TaxID=2137479 RepID=A0A4Q1JRQ1_9GAMM|nr:type 2 isopentenyl-diphosphate Delta-isomerase [Pseudoxanthomonas composti]RXR00875.1 type 2 isopentenyl-diphosphate Delta-isomerase [Pseudoxanthomonas composti]
MGLASKGAAPDCHVSRKNDHLDIVLDQRRALARTRTGLDGYRFEHCALPELDLDAISLETRFLGRDLKAPFLISSMTGGALRAKGINRHLAEAAQALRIAIAVGSQRVALETAADHGLTRDLRKRAPDVPILANLGAAQLRSGGVQLALRAVQMIDADALIIHLNPLQEAVQAGGDRDWRGVLVALETLARQSRTPIVVKEVGAGLSAEVARQLVEAGVAVIDVAGAGGTSWAAVESERAPTLRDRAVASAFANWGIPTAEALVAVRQCLPTVPLIASGGVRDGIDAAKAIALGADLIGQAASVLNSAVESTESVIEHFEVMAQQLRIACFCTGSGDLAALRQARLVRQREPGSIEAA